MHPGLLLLPTELPIENFSLSSLYLSKSQYISIVNNHMIKRTSKVASVC